MMVQRKNATPLVVCTVCKGLFKRRLTHGSANLFCGRACQRAGGRGGGPLHPETTIVQAQVLWLEGHSVSEIGRRMGVTKNVIIGIAHRNGFAARPSPIRRAA